MKLFMPALFLFALFSHPHAYADPSPSPSGFPISISQPASPSPSVVAVAEPAAPPAWAQQLMVTAQKLPVIGPIVSKALLYLGILASVLTMLAGFLIGALQAISGAFSYAGLTNAVAAIGAFQNGKFMYYLKYFSLFNAQKPSPQ